MNSLANRWYFRCGFIRVIFGAVQFFYNFNTCMSSLFSSVKITELPPLLTRIVTCNFIICLVKVSVFPFDVGVSFGF